MSLMTSEKLAMTFSMVMTHTSVTDPITGQAVRCHSEACKLAKGPGQALQVSMASLLFLYCMI